jgi:5-dehydro-2-deoxygluconokinase
MSVPGDVELDLVTIGRVSVDLYGQQIGSRLEDVATFAKAVGGCPANIAIGAARLGLKSALISRVGDEAMGRFVREQLGREGVELRGVGVDPQRLTALVLLSVRDAESFPLIFYRENCADSALSEQDIDARFVAGARAVLVTGTHFSLPAAARAQRKAIGIARAHGRRVLLDIDYRPNLWGIGGHGAGETRYAAAAHVTGTLREVLPECDLIVGTEEELHIAAGTEDTLEALHRIRGLTQALIVCKRGARGCIVLDGPIPAALEQGLVAGGRDIEVYNVLGAGDAFLAGFLSGYLRDAPHAQSARLANACGAIAVSRLLCSSEFATLAELNHYLGEGSPHRALREDTRLEHLHRVTTRRRAPRPLLVLGVDDDGQLAQLAQRLEAPAQRAARIAQITVAAVSQLAGSTEGGLGVLLGPGTSAAALRQALQANLWVARTVHKPRTRPLEFLYADSLAVRLNEWPTAVTASCECEYHLSDPPELRRAQERRLLRLASACHAQGRELLLTVTAGERGGLREDTLARVLDRLYQLQIRPDWWQLPPQAEAAAWQRCAAVIAANDAHCRGILVHVQAPLEEAQRQLALAAASPIVRGLIAGGSILVRAAQAWLSGQTADAVAREQFAARFRVLLAAWAAARDPRLDAPQRSRH